MQSSSLNPEAQEWRPSTPHSLEFPLNHPHCYVLLHIHVPYYYIVAPPLSPAVLPPAQPLDGHDFTPHAPQRTERGGVRGRSKPKATTLNRREWRPKKDNRSSDERVAAGNSSAAQARPCPPPRKTTIMIRNIPNQFRREDMLEFLDGYCDLDVAYDFLYLLMDFRKEDNLGYAFVNFTTWRAALKIKRSLQNYKWGVIHTQKGTFTSNKVCDIKWARVQGKERQIKRFENSKFDCEKLEFLPVVFDPPRNRSNTKSDPIIVGQLKK